MIEFINVCKVNHFSRIAKGRTAKRDAPTLCVMRWRSKLSHGHTATLHFAFGKFERRSGWLTAVAPLDFSQKFGGKPRGAGRICQRHNPKNAGCKRDVVQGWEHIRKQAQLLLFMNEPDVSPILPRLQSVLYRSATAEKT